jgi:hypothetical protein
MRSVIPAFDDRRQLRTVTEGGAVVRSAWDAMLFAERCGGWPLVLSPLEPTGAEDALHVADVTEAAVVLERDGRPWLARTWSSSTARRTRSW